MYCSTIAAVPMLSWMNCHALLELLVAVDDGGLRDADGRFLRQRLHDERERADACCRGSAGRRGKRRTPARGCGDTTRSFFESDLSRASSRPRGLHPVYDELQQLEMADDVLVEDRHVVEPLEQVEGDVRLPLFVGAADVAEVVVDGERPHLVAEPRQRRDDVVLGAPGRRRDVGAFFDLLRRHQMPVHQREHAQLVRAHSATR